MNPSTNDGPDPYPARTSFILASRASKLAQIQTNTVLTALQKAFPTFTFTTSFMITEGDKNQSQALYLLGGKALWTKELQVALIDNVVDILVHSLKDVPTVLPPECEIGAILEREDPVDSLVVKTGLPYTSLDELPVGSVIGTSSVRRVAQLRRMYPHLQFLDVRGNLNTRLTKLDSENGPYSALILAKAGLVRLGMGHRVIADLRPPTFYHAVSQGALAVEIRSDDAQARELCRALTHWQTQWKCLAERACLRTLEGGCSVPVGVASQLQVFSDEQAGLLTLTGCVTAIDGQRHVEHTLNEPVRTPAEAEELGSRLAQTLIQTGAAAILDEIKKDRINRAEAESGES